MEDSQAARVPDRTAPSADRQADLEAEYAKNIAEGKAPYQGVIIRTLGELEWVMKQRNWSGDLIPRAGAERANLSGVLLEGNRLSHVSDWGINLTGVRLWGARLAGAKLWRANLKNADLVEADLSTAEMSGSNLTNANLNHATLSNANLGGANLSGTVLIEAKLTGAYLGSCRFDIETRLSETILDSTTSLADVVWNNVPLTRVNWRSVPMLGDEMIAWEQTSRHFAFQSTAFTFSEQKSSIQRIEEFEAATRAYRQLAVALRSQGLSYDADRYAYRAQLMQREVLRWNQQWGGFLFSWLLFLISGYGYRLWHILVAYGATLLVFTLIYWGFGVHSFSHESGAQALWDSFLVSLSAIHGRTTFEQLGAWSSAAWTAAVESVCGLVIEGVFIAMLIQRFFTH